MHNQTGPSPKLIKLPIRGGGGRGMLPWIFLNLDRYRPILNNVSLNIISPFYIKRFNLFASKIYIPNYIIYSHIL